MPDTNDMIGFLNDATCKDNDIVEILGAGTIEQKPDKQKPGRTYPELSMPVRCNGRELTWTPNKEAREVFDKKYGTKTEGWVGKKFQVKLYPKTSFGQTKMVILPVLMEQ